MSKNKNLTVEGMYDKLGYLTFFFSRFSHLRTFKCMEDIRILFYYFYDNFMSMKATHCLEL